MDLYGHLLDQVRSEGLRGLWLTVERTRGIRSDILEEERYLEEERLVEGFAAAGGDAVLLCQYNASVIRGPSADALRSVHDLEFVEAGQRPLGGNLPQLEVSPTDEGIALSGEVDLGSWAILRDALTSVAGGAEGEDVILDVGGLSFMDGHGMSLIAQATRELAPSRRLVVRGATPTLIRAAEILGFDREPGLVIEGSSHNGDR